MFLFRLSRLNQTPSKLCALDEGLVGNLENFERSRQISRRVCVEFRGVVQRTREKLDERSIGEKLVAAWGFGGICGIAAGAAAGAAAATTTAARATATAAAT
jgi:hypothetical protein